MSVGTMTLTNGSEVPVVKFTESNEMRWNIGTSHGVRQISICKWVVTHTHVEERRDIMEERVFNKLDMTRHGTEQGGENKPTRECFRLKTLSGQERDKRLP